MSVFAIVFGSLIGLGGFAVLIAGIALGGDPGMFIISFFFMGLGIPLVLMGISRLKKKNEVQKSARAASDATGAAVSSSAYSPAVSKGVASGRIREAFDLKDIIVPVLEKRMDELTVNKPDNGGCIYYEKDNMGTRQDTFDKAATYWTARRQLVKKPPFVLFVFNHEKDARDALLELPCIHNAADSNQLICTDVLIFGYYPISGSFEVILCGEDLTYELWEQARNSFIRHGGTLKNEEVPNKKEIAQSHTPVQLDSVKFVKEQHVKDQYGDTVYQVYEAPDADTAKDFLSRNPVDKQLFYIVVETPEGNYGRDINGIYKEESMTDS